MLAFAGTQIAASIVINWGILILVWLFLLFIAVLVVMLVQRLVSKRNPRAPIVFDKIEKLESLSQMKERGDINKDEYNKLKAKVLSP